MYPVGLVKQLQIGAVGVAWRPGAIMDDKYYSEMVGREVTGLEEARDLGRRVAICSKIVQAGIQHFDPSEYGESWRFDRGKIPDLKEARERMKRIEKELGIKYS
jgi:hypothetical protein